MQLDADEDGEPFFKPSVVDPTPSARPEDRQSQQQQQQPQQTGEPQETAAAVAATVTAEQEE